MDSELVEETPPTQEETPAQGGKDSLIKLLSMPFSALSQRLKRTTLDLKETAVIETWGLIGQHVRDFTLYSESGVLGTTYLLFRVLYLYIYIYIYCWLKIKCKKSYTFENNFWKIKCKKGYTFNV